MFIRMTAVRRKQRRDVVFVLNMVTFSLKDREREMFGKIEVEERRLALKRINVKKGTLIYICGSMLHAFLFVFFFLLGTFLRLSTICKIHIIKITKILQLFLRFRLNC